MGVIGPQMSSLDNYQLPRDNRSQPSSDNYSVSDLVNRHVINNLPNMLSVIMEAAHDYSVRSEEVFDSSQFGESIA